MGLGTGLRLNAILELKMIVTMKSKPSGVHPYSGKNFVPPPLPDIFINTITDIQCVRPITRQYQRQLFG